MTNDTSLNEAIRSLLNTALEEDGVDRDVTSAISIAADLAIQGRFRLTAREPGSFAGEKLLTALAERYSDQIRIDCRIGDGGRFVGGQALAMLEGNVQTILGVERTLLNFLQRLCGVASFTYRFVEATAGTEAKIYDTRKTIPGWRELDKYAVRCGGGKNHRMGLHDAVLIKDNHIAGIPSERLAAVLEEIVGRLDKARHRHDFVEVEVDALEQLREVIKVSGIDVILLDNFTIGQICQAVEIRDTAGLRGRVALEVSGGVRVEDVAAIAATGVDRIAIGALTHSARAIDIGLDREE